MVTEKGKKKEALKLLSHVPKTTHPLFPLCLKKEVKDDKFQKFIYMLKQLRNNAPLVEALEHMFGYAKFMKAQVIQEDTTRKL